MSILQIPRRGMMGGGLYTPLKYVKSTGAQAINTGVKPTLDTRLWVQGFYLQGNGSFYPLMGSSNPSCMVFGYAGVGGNTGFCSFGNQIDKTIPAYLPAGAELPVITIAKNGATMSVEDVGAWSVSFTATAMSGNANTEIYLFARGNSGTYERQCKGQIYRAKIYNGDDLIRDFVPAKRNADNEIGMYDMVNDVFYTNLTDTPLIGG